MNYCVINVLIDKWKYMVNTEGRLFIHLTSTLPVLHLTLPPPRPFHLSFSFGRVLNGIWNCVDCTNSTSPPPLIAAYQPTHLEGPLLFCYTSQATDEGL